MVAMSLLFAVIILMLVWAAFCAGAETGFLSVSRERVIHLSRTGGRKAQIVQKALSDMGRTTTTLLIGNNLASVAYSTACAAVSDNALWSFFAAFMVLYCSEFMPKLLFAARPLRRTLLIADAYAWMARVLTPLTAVAMRITDLFMPDRKDSRYRLTSADLVRILQDRKDGVRLSDIESALISRIIVSRIKGKSVTAKTLLDVLKDSE